jgi:ribosomal protein L23
MIISNNKYFALAIKPYMSGYIVKKITKDGSELNPITFEVKKKMTKKELFLSKEEIKALYDMTVGQDEIDRMTEDLNNRFVGA